MPARAQIGIPEPAESLESFCARAGKGRARQKTHQRLALFLGAFSASAADPAGLTSSRWPSDLQRTSAEQGLARARAGTARFILNRFPRDYAKIPRFGWVVIATTRLHTLALPLRALRSPKSPMDRSEVRGHADKPLERFIKRAPSNSGLGPRLLALPGRRTIERAQMSVTASRLLPLDATDGKAVRRSPFCGAALAQILL
jgi:hypothetical protein